MRVALEALGMSISDAADQIAEQKLARVSRTALNNIVLGYTTTTRTSVLGALTTVTGQHEKWLAGFGQDLTAVDLITRRLVARGWDYDHAFRARTDHGDPVAALREYSALVEHARRTAREILNIENWERLLIGRGNKATEEQRVRFARLLADALLTVHWLDREHASSFAGLEAQAAFLREPSRVTRTIEKVVTKPPEKAKAVKTQ